MYVLIMCFIYKEYQFKHKGDNQPVTPIAYICIWYITKGDKSTNYTYSLHFVIGTK